MIEIGTYKCPSAQTLMNRSVLVLVTNQFNCDRLIITGHQIAKVSGLPLFVVNVQSRQETHASNPDALQHLYNVSAQHDAEMTIFFSDKPYQKLCECIADYRASHVVTGIPVGEDSVVNRLYKNFPDITFYNVETTGEHRRMAPTESVQQKARA